MTARVAEDLSGKTFGKLTVVDFAGRRGSTRARLWNCLCECGGKTTSSGSDLRAGKAKSCGCMKGRDRIDPSIRFWNLVKKIPDGCWIFLGNRTRGRGKFRVDTKESMVSASHFSWEFFFGPIFGEAQVLHKCDNPPCVKPAHLFLGTQQDNVTDMMDKGRWGGPIGEMHPNARFSDADVVDVCRKFFVDGQTRESLAAEYGVSVTAIRHMVIGKTWRHVNDGFRVLACGLTVG